MAEPITLELWPELALAAEPEEALLPPVPMDLAPVSADGLEDVAVHETPEGQIAFVEKPDWWKEHWQGMPEFSQQDLSPHRTLYVHFEKREDVLDFFTLIGQHCTPDTQYIWFPQVARQQFANKKYVDLEVPSEPRLSHLCAEQGEMDHQAHHESSGEDGSALHGSP